MPAATELVSFIEAKEYTGAGEGGSERLRQVVDAALAYCGRKIGFSVLSAQYVPVLDGSGSNELFLPHAPITAVTKVERLTDVVALTWEELTAADYPVVIVTPGRRRIAFRNAVFTCGIQNWRITLNAGYGDADEVCPIPDDLHEAALHVVDSLWRAPERQAAGIASISVSGPNGSTTSYLDQVLPRQTLDVFAELRKRRW